MFMQSERWRSQCSSAYVAAAVMCGMRYGGRKVRETHAEGCHGNWRGLDGCNPAMF